MEPWDHEAVDIFGALGETVKGLVDQKDVGFLIGGVKCVDQLLNSGGIDLDNYYQTPYTIYFLIHRAHT